MTAGRQLPRWPLFVIALPAAVAVWSGWVGLGGMCGFGPVNLLPGFGAGLHVNTAITLPVGVEAYGAYALGAWLAPGTPDRARSFARRSAVGALALGMLGQVVYHLLAAAGARRAPWPVVVLVACLPVVTLGFGAGLSHLLRPGAEHAAPEVEHAAPEVEHAAPEVEHAAPEVEHAAPEVEHAAPGCAHGLNEAESMFAVELAADGVPPLRRIREEMHVGGPRAKRIQQHLQTCASVRRGAPVVTIDSWSKTRAIRQGSRDWKP